VKPGAKCGVWPQTCVFELSAIDPNGADMKIPEPKLYSVRSTAALLGVGRTTAWKFITNGTLETVHLGGRRMVRAESLHQLIKRGTRERVA
jgi:excisionase family DNA binding protein